MTHEELIKAQIAGLSDHDALQHIGILIDESTDAISTEGNDRAYELWTSLKSAH
jgi:hypothetical protein